MNSREQKPGVEEGEAGTRVVDGSEPRGPKLYVIATPIGNREDISLRALRILREEVDLIAAEDTRHSLPLLQHYDVHARLISYHQHNEAKRCADFARDFDQGRVIALISDAGMPGLSDPGERLITLCLDRDIPIEVIPGASAILQALVGSGLPMIPFYFGGFLPVKSGGRLRELTAAAERTATSIFFESPHRILRSLEVLAEVAPDRPCCVARELTKKFEEYRRATPAKLLAHFSQGKVRGEICLLVGPASARKHQAKAIA